MMFFTRNIATSRLNPRVLLEFFLLRILNVITFLSLVISSTVSITCAPSTIG